MKKRMRANKNKDKQDKSVECPICGGKGQVKHRRDITWPEKEYKCMFCDGKGKLEIGKTE